MLPLESQGSGSEGGSRCKGAGEDVLSFLTSSTITKKERKEENNSWNVFLFHLCITPSLVTLVGSSARRRPSGTGLLSLVSRTVSTLAVVDDAPARSGPACPAASPGSTRGAWLGRGVQRGGRVAWTLVLAPREHKSWQNVPKDQSNVSWGGQHQAVLSSAGSSSNAPGNSVRGRDKSAGSAGHCRISRAFVPGLPSAPLY